MFWVPWMLGICLLAWWIATRDWPAWAKVVLLCFIGSCGGFPSTYDTYLRGLERQAELADLPRREGGGALGKCRACGQYTYAVEPACVRCGAPDPIPNAVDLVRSLRFTTWLGRVVLASVAVTIVYLVVSALARALG